MLYDERKIKIYKYLLTARKPVSKTELAGAAGVSERTLHQEIKDMNQVSADTGIHIAYIRQTGYQLVIENETLHLAFEKQLKEKHTESSLDAPRQRAAAIAAMIINAKTYVTIYDIAEALYISRTTAAGDLKLVKKLLEKYNLNLLSKSGKGLYIEGEEKKKRFGLVSLLAETSIFTGYLEKQGIKTESIRKMEAGLAELFTSFGFKFTDEGLHNLALHAAVMKGRIEMQEAITQDIDISVPAEHQELLGHLEQLITECFAAAVPRQELLYFYMLVSSRIVLVSDRRDIEKLPEYPYICSILERIRDRYQYDLTGDIQLIFDLASHMHSMLFRVERQISIRNPMEEHIKKYYPLAFEITLDAVAALKQNYQYHISHAEIGFLALHIGASLERNYNVLYERHKSCLIVCGTGLSTARIIEAVVRQSVTDIYKTRIMAVHEYNSLSYIEEDFVLSTVTLDQKNKPVYLISQLPTRQQIREIDREVTNEIKNTSRLLDMFFAEPFVIKSKAESREQVLKEAAEVLKQQGAIKDQEKFYQSVLDREELGITHLGNGVAIPHPMDMTAEKSCICTMLMEKPVSWNPEKQAELVFVLSVSKKDYEDIRKLYDFIVEIVHGNHAKALSRTISHTQFIETAKQIIKQGAVW